MGKGATTMEVTASNGLKKNCFIIVRENKADINFLEDPLSRVEWNTEIGCSDAQDGFSFAEYKSMDAFGGGNANTMTYDFSTVEDTEVFYRVSAKGDFTVAGDLSDGLVVVKKDNKMEYYKADKVVLKQIKDGQFYILFYLPDNITVRVVTMAL
mgnify:FL=1